MEEAREKCFWINKKIKRVLLAREELEQTSIKLLECDGVYVHKIKSELKGMTFANRVVPFVGAGGPLPLDAETVKFYLDDHYRIYVREENITVDLEKMRCQIRLNDDIVVTVPIEDKVGVKSIESRRKD